MKRLSEFWKFLIGDKGLFSLENRIFHTICGIGFLAIVLDVFVNLFTRSEELFILSLVILVVHSTFFYLSRFRRKGVLAITLYAVLNNFIFSFYFYFNEGINGGALLIYALSFYLFILVSPHNKYRFWLIFNVFVVLGSFLVQYHHPELIPDSFGEKDRFIQLFFVYLSVVMFFYVGTTYLKRNYEHERLMAEERARAVGSQNKMLLVQNEEFQRLANERAKLFSIIAHDLRAPLNSIQNYLQFLKDYELDPKDKEEVETQLLQSTRITSEMLVNLLSWSKAQMAGISVSIQRINLLKSVLNTIEMQSSLAAMKGIDFKYDIDPEMELPADVNILQLIVRNLLHNAVKFTPEGGSILLEAKQVDNEFLINVADSGVGISEDQQEKIFSSSLKSGRGTENENGIGLGLILCNEFASRMNGSISFSSKKGEGSVFTLRLNS